LPDGLRKDKMRLDKAIVLTVGLLFYNITKIMISGLPDSILEWSAGEWFYLSIFSAGSLVFFAFALRDG
jgi:hypothetical protein